jgi:hypothetical protein
MVARGALGLIAPSSFFVPQVNLPGSMASFVTPAIPRQAVVVAAANAKRGSGSAQAGRCRRKSGLGAAGAILYGSQVDTGLGTSVDCSQFGNWMLNTACWQLSPGSWAALKTANQATYPLPPMPAPPAAPQTAEQAATWTPDAALAQGMTTTQAQNMNFFQTANIPSDPAPDCGDPWTAFVNPTCGIFGLPYVALGAAGLVVVWLLARK